VSISIVKQKFTPAGLSVIVIGLAWLFYGAFFAPTGLFTDDEVIYVAMIDRFATAGSFVIENGYEVNQAESLRLVTMRAGPHGLVPQYPAGYAVLAAPFYLLGGLRGIIILNTLASVLTLWLTYKIARALFEDERLAVNAALIFGLATFAVDYAFAIWPHAAANAFVAASIYAAVRSVNEARRTWLWAAWAGIAIGLGATIRVDVVIAAPFLLAWIFVNAKHQPGRSLAAFVFALGAGLALAAYLNLLKFGVFNPIYYGASLGKHTSTSLTNYVRYLPYAFLAWALFLVFRWQRIQRLAKGKSGWILLGLGVAVTASVPSIRELASKLAHGLYVLVVDLRTLSAIDSHPRIQNIGGQYFLYYETLKKSLLESLPYLGTALITFAAIFRLERRSAYFLCFFLPLIWFLPLAASEWVGGRGNNMRYFSAMLPLLAIIGAIAWGAVSTHDTKRLIWMPILAIALAGGLLYFSAASVNGLAWNQAFFVTGWVQWFGLAMLVLSIAWMAFPNWQDKLRLPIALMIQLSFMLAFVAGYAFDAAATYKIRAEVERQRENFSYIEANSHIFSRGHFALYFQLLRPDATLAYYVPDEIESDLEYMQIALNSARPVYIDTVELARVVKEALDNGGFGYGDEGYVIERSVSPVDGRLYDLYRLRRSGSGYNREF